MGIIGLNDPAQDCSKSNALAGGEITKQVHYMNE